VFDNKDATIKKLRSGQSNASDVPSGVATRDAVEHVFAHQKNRFELF